MKVTNLAPDMDSIKIELDNGDTIEVDRNEIGMVAVTITANKKQEVYLLGDEDA